MEILMAAASVLSLYLGYRLFCDCADPKNRMRHLASGALLAVFGLGILIADIHAHRARAHHSHSARQKNATEEGSFEPPNFNRSGKPARTHDLMRMT